MSKIEAPCRFSQIFSSNGPYCFCLPLHSKDVFSQLIFIILFLLVMDNFENKLAQVFCILVFT